MTELVSRRPTLQKGVGRRETMIEPKIDRQLAIIANVKDVGTLSRLPITTLISAQGVITYSISATYTVSDNALHEK